MTLRGDGGFFAGVLNGFVGVLVECSAHTVIFGDEDDAEGAFFEHAGK